MIQVVVEEAFPLEEAVATMTFTMMMSFLRKRMTRSIIVVDLVLEAEVVNRL